MRSFYALSAATLALALAACSAGTGNLTTTNVNRTNANAVASPTVAASPVSAHLPHPDARRISVAELQAALARNEAVIIDVRSESQFNDGHIRGALHIPGGEVGGRASELPRDKMIVTYCS